ncbi:unnamed protein product [Ectocarpus fasciculatus]
MESESDVGGSEEEDYGKAFDLADDDDDDDKEDKDKEDETEPSDGEYVIPIRPIRKVKRKNGRKYYPPSEFEPADVGPDGKVVVPVKAEASFKETAEERRKREAEEEKEELERKEFMENFRKAREDEESNRAVKAAKKQQEDEVAEEDARRKEEKLGRVFAGEGDIMEEYERDKVEQDALQQLLQDSMKKKELKPVDHSKISYISLRKNLYIIPKALAVASEEKKENDRLELEIKVRGKGCPPVLHSWEQCGFSDRVLAVIRRNNFEKPFAIQKQAMPALMSGRDVIGVASTGSGKTLAFLLPLLRHIFDQPVLGEGEGPIGLIMAPARELAVQIYNEARKFTKALGLRVTAVYGGAGVADQIADLKRGAEIVVCTPGRMIDILTMQAGKLVSLDRVSFVVLDEADRMFDMGFEPQIKMILQNVRPDRQTALFSATFPRTVETLAKRVLKMPLEIIVGGRSIASSDITQHVEIRDDDDKFMRLLQLLGVWYEKGNILVFVDTQSKCDTLFQDLSRAGYHGLSLHGGKDQTDRDFTIADFKNKSATLMVATSVAGRGLDVPDLVCVINYSCPNHLEDYVHRVGRTGRAGRKGTAYTFISAEEEKHAPTLIKALTQSKQKIPPELVKMAEEFQGKVDSGQARKASSGFSGKGFTFDDSEQSESQQMRSLEKRQYEIEQGLRDPSELLGGKEKGEEGDEGDEEESEATKAARAENLTKAAITAASKLLKSTDEVERMKGAAMMTAAKLGLAVPRPEPGGEGKDGKPKTPQEALKEAAAIALRYFSPDGKGPDAEPSHFTDKIVINDFPQQARWKITQKSTVNEVYEMTGVAIITKGMYIGNNQKPKEGEEKLHLVIEGKSDIDVQAGISEIRRILNEETMKVASSSSFSSGKYSVI